MAKQLADTLTEHGFYIGGPPPMTDALMRMLTVEHKEPLVQIDFIE